MPIAEINGHPLYFEDSGGHGSPVVLSHGFLMDHEMFAPQVAALAGEFRCVTWDERGFGQTLAGGPFSYWDSAADVLALLSYLEIERAVLGGMSQGGFISMRAALLAPERVGGLVLIDTQAGTEDPDHLPGYEAMNKEWQANGPAAVQDPIAGLILGAGLDPQPWLAKWAAMERHQFDLAYRCLADREDISDRLGEIGAPAIIFHGDQDQAIPMEKAEALRDGLSGCEALVVVEGAAHAANLSHPEQLNGPLLDFLRRHT
jgi:pimeloyl-ACP methyl ester carboxylesterase